MIGITVIGSGNVAQHLISVLLNNDAIQIIQVFARNTKNVAHLVEKEKIVSHFEELHEADLYIISVSDNAIAEVSSKLQFQNKLVAHTSGSCSMDELNTNNRKAVFYPLQTFSKTKEINFKEVALCLEAEYESDYQLLEKVADLLSDKVYKINSNQRKSLHISAVFVSNFVNHLYQIGNEICNENKVDFEILKPLIQETANKILLLSPNEAQTGPAKRNDTKIINAHLQYLTNENQKEIYKILTKSIIDNGKKL